jgi:hypothetical protein
MNYRILRLQEIVDSLIIVISKSIHLAVLLDRKSALFSFGPLQQVTYNRLPTILYVCLLHALTVTFSHLFYIDIEANDNKLASCPLCHSVCFVLM